jgi:hypothetical protein
MVITDTGMTSPVPIVALSVKQVSVFGGVWRCSTEKERHNLHLTVVNYTYLLIVKKIGSLAMNSSIFLGRPFIIRN